MIFKIVLLDRLDFTAIQNFFSGVVPAYNLLISAPEKCASEFWFRIMEFLNFPQVSWPRGQTDKKHYQMRYMLPMVHEIEGAAESLATRGSTLAIVRHPLLRLVSGLVENLKSLNPYVPTKPTLVFSHP